MTSENLNVIYVYFDATNWESQAQAFKTAIKNSPTKRLDVVALFAGASSTVGNLVDHVTVNVDGARSIPKYQCRI
jgi:hypothetical protein